MSPTLVKRILLSAVALLLCVASPAVATPLSPAPLDLGPSDPNAPMLASIHLSIQNQADLANLITATVTPGNPQFHQFLSVGDFVTRYAPSDDYVHQVRLYLTSFGIKIVTVYLDNLVIVASGTTAQFNAAFGMVIHQYQAGSRQFYRPNVKPRFPANLAGGVLSISGLSTEHVFTHHHMARPAALGNPAVVLPKIGIATGTPGSYTVGDVANLYQVNPLYQAGVTGTGRKIGIVTLANFDPNDAYAYWSQLGIPVSADRIKQVHVDGGGPTGSNAGSDETTIDVEQAGGLAPAANVIVYDGPNTDTGFLDVFYQAASEDKVDTLSCSWGEAEGFYFNSALTGYDDTATLESFHEVFMELAVQGISVFVAAGDEGAYDANRAVPYPQFSPLISVDSPGADPYVTAAGGTTVPITLNLQHGNITIPNERVWGWDYLTNYIVTNYGSSYFYQNIYLVGGGGGVSVYWPLPAYQQSLSGVQISQFGQDLIYYPNYPDPSGAIDALDLQGGVVGRNMPDLSLNADPETGYLLYYQGGWQGGWGGTSFVAPQLNGIFSLIVQAAGTRLGLVNPQLYALLARDGYGGYHSFNDIRCGDNWFYSGITGYDPGSGIGTINAANLASALTHYGH